MVLFFKKIKKFNWSILILVFLLGFIIGKASIVNENKNFEIKNNPIKNTIFLTPTLILNQDFYPVIKVVDGDTIDVEIDNQVKRIRIIGINTPEVADPRKTVECFGKEALNKAKEILTGKKVKLEEDLTQGNADKYGRLLRYVFLEDGTDFGLLMIKEGYAYEYTYNIPYKHQQKYKKAQKEAQENKKGLWADGVCSSFK